MQVLPWKWIFQRYEHVMGWDVMLWCSVEMWLCMCFSQCSYVECGCWMLDGMCDSKRRVVLRRVVCCVID